jgi:ecotropic viral integration site 5 protein
MSYIEICEKFEEVTDYLNNSNEETALLSKFFVSYKKILENFSNQLQKLGESLKINFQSENNLNTLTMSILSLKEHILKISEHQLQLVKTLQLDIIEPLDLFSGHFLSTTLDLKTKGSYHYKELKTSQTRMNKCKQEYYKTSSELEKATRLAATEENKDKHEQAQRLAIHYMSLQEHHLDNYIQGILDVNKHWDKYDNTMPPIMEGLQQNEESRIHFIKTSLEKYIRHFQKYQINLNTNIEKLGDIVMNVNSAIDIRVFVDLHKSKSFVSREQFVNYEDWKASLNEKEYEVVENESALINTAVESFLVYDEVDKSSGIESENFSKLSELISCPEGKKLFIDTLQSKVNQPYVEYQKLAQLAALIKELLSSMVRENESDPLLFCSIIALSVSFFTHENGRKKTLSSYISPHIAWIDPKRWLQAIDYTINSKTASDKEISQKHKKKFKILNFLADIVKNSSLNPEKAEKASVYLILSQFSFHMVKLNIPIEIACSIIMSSAKSYRINEDRVMLLISELQARSDLILDIPKKSRLDDRKDLIKIAPIITKYLNDLEICNLSRVSKEFQVALLRKKYKRMILNPKYTLVYPGLRKQAWVSILNAKNYQMDYQKILSVLSNSSNLIGELKDLIEVDVARSFQKNPEIHSTNLKNILEVYAYYNKDVGYCQGMNYIAGTLFLVTQDEEISCKCLSSMVEIFSMNSLFTNNLKKLKKLFYILDRLIVIILPELNESFKDAWIFSDHFSSAWFLTLFSSILHGKLEVLVKIWDLFFIQGWKAIFKISIVILMTYSDKLIDKKFEDILYILGNLSNSNIFTQEFFYEVQKLKLSNSLIDEIEKEYENIIIRSTYNY